MASNLRLMVTAEVQPFFLASVGAWQLLGAPRLGLVTYVLDFLEGRQLRGPKS